MEPSSQSKSQPRRFYLGLPFSIGRGGFIADTLTISVGTLISQIILFLVSPALTRLYAPEDFGAFSIFSFLVAIPSVLSCWALEPAVILPKEDDEALLVLTACLAASLVTALALLLAMLPFQGSIGAYFKVPQISPWLWLAPVYVLTIGIFQGLSYWNTRKKMFREQSAARISQSVGASAPQVAAGFFQASAGGLIWGYVAGQVVGAAVLAGGLPRESWRKIGHLACLRNIGRVLRRYRNFPLFSSWGTLMNIGAFQIVPVLFSRWFTPSEAGYYYLGFRILSAPISLLGSAVGQVFFQRTGEHPAHIPGLVAKILARMIVFLTPPFIALFFFAEPAFRFVFGEDWTMTGRFIQSMVPMFFLQFLASPLSFILIVLERQRIAAGIQFLLLATTVLSLSLGRIWTENAVETLRIYAATESAVYFLYLLVVLRQASVTGRQVWDEFWSFLRIKSL